MLAAILVILIILWFLGYGPIQGLSIPLFTFLGRTINLWDIVTFLVVIWLVSALPSPFGQIASVLLIIWLLSVLGILAFGGLSSMLVLAIIIGLVIYILRGY